MKQSEYFIKTVKEVPADEVAINAQLLIRAGYIDKLMAGVYTYLPLGVRVLSKIKNIVREEMVKVGGDEVLMPALQPKSLWSETGRWDEIKDILFQFKGRGGADMCLGPTHEENVVAIARTRVNSYKDLPFALFQIQDKFRNEPRAKNGLLRGREFSMKDLYSFHTDVEDLRAYYEKVKKAYLNMYDRLGMPVIAVEASGGSFSKDFSHEFQTLTASGEDTIFHCDCGWAQNKEIAKVKKGAKCPACKDGVVMMSKGIEVGNIFKLNQKYSKSMNLLFTNAEGKQDNVYMGCYGFGVSRAMGAIVEISHDKDGIIWPKNIAPFQIHLLSLGTDKKVLKDAEDVYKKLKDSGIDVLYDDRDESVGMKLKEADLIGIPIRLVVSNKTNGLIEYKERSSDEVRKVAVEDVIKLVKEYYA
ncbi:MAG: aminoacyl--tRNA ligase-related protein [Candidatus Komeilibacteria bacterium]